VTYARVLGGKVNALAVRNGQGIDIGAESDKTGGIVEAAGQDVAVRAGSDWQHLRDQPNPLKIVDNKRRGAMLVVADLWMGMDVASDGDQSLVQSGG
jgi:hypothetical protein